MFGGSGVDPTWGLNHGPRAAFYIVGLAACAMNGNPLGDYALVVGAFIVHTGIATLRRKEMA